MRSYPHDSPRAAARIVALAMIADGHISRIEWDALLRAEGFARFGLGPAQWDGLIHECCHDLLAQCHLSWDQCCWVDARTLEGLLSEVGDPALRRCVAFTCVAVVEADNVVTEGEWRLLSLAIDRWGLQRELLRPPALDG